MALDPAEFLAHASLLMEVGGEAGCRSSINRAYYACHLMARDRLFGLDATRWEPPPRRPSHRAVVRALLRSLPVGDAADQLELLRRTREIADYVRDSAHPEAQAMFRRRGVSGWRELAQVSLAHAREVFAALQRLPAEA